jgi:shikimate kinase
MNPTDPNLLRGVNLFLIGMMGAGKSTVGRLLADYLNYHFFDTDDLIEQATGQTIAQIFAESGETIFRQLETQVLSELSAHTRLAIATGGGIVMNPVNWSYLHHGVVVWLDVAPEQLYERLRQDTQRPLLQTSNPQQTIQDLLDKRQSLYAQADVRIEVRTGESPEQVAEQIVQEIARIKRPDTPADPGAIEQNGQ